MTRRRVHTPWRIRLVRFLAIMAHRTPTFGYPEPPYPPITRKRWKLILASFAGRTPSHGYDWPTDEPSQPKEPPCST